MAGLLSLSQVEGRLRLRTRGRCVHPEGKGRIPPFEGVERRTRDTLLRMLPQQRELLHVIELIPNVRGPRAALGGVSDVLV
jgi:hypothetical protein